jgi:hypothetical protein
MDAMMILNEKRRRGEQQQEASEFLTELRAEIARERVRPSSPSPSPRL